MTPSFGRPGPARPCAEVRAGDLDVTPGVTSAFSVELTSRLPERATFAVTVIGLEPEWVDPPALVGPVQPGETVTFVLRVCLPVGYPPSSLSVSVSAQPAAAVEAGAAEAWAAGAGDLVVTVGDGSQVAMALDPIDLRGSRGARFEVVLRNRARAATRVELTTTSPEAEVQIEFADPSPVLPPGREVRVKARARGQRPTAGPARRLPFAVRAQGRSSPIQVDGSLTLRPRLPSWGTKTIAIVAVIALWVAVAVVAIAALEHHLAKNTTSRSVNAAKPLAPVSSPTGGSSTSGGGSSGGSGSGSGGSSSGSSGGSAGAGFAGGAGSQRLSGKVTGSQAGDVAVSIEPTSLVDPATQGAVMLDAARSSALGAITVSDPFVGAWTMPDAASRVVTDALVESTATSKSAPVGKVFGNAGGASFDQDLTTSTTPELTAMTTPDGSWAFSGINAPGTYLVTFAKDGFTTEKYIVATTSGGSPIQLNTSLVAGDGSISGSVVGPSGPLGDVSVTVTDGTDTLTTHTPTIGAGVGNWSVSGLGTPDTYLVTATAPGYGTQTVVVSLAAGQTATGINLTMTPGVGTITGTVVSSRTGAPVGGVTVTASNGSTTLTATTLTANPVGAYTLPNLPIPGTYALTVSGTGWVSQTQQVNLDGNQVVNATLTPSTADVTGVIFDNSGNPLVDAGVTLANSSVTYKTLTETASPAGGFDFGDIAPGQYVLTAEDFGYTSQSAEVSVASGQLESINLILPYVGAASLDTGSIEGSAQDLFNATAVVGATVSVDGVTQAGVTTNANGVYQVSDVAPGVHSVTLTMLNYEPTTVLVTVPLGGTGFAPVAEMPRLDSVSGAITSVDGAALAPFGTDPTTDTVVALCAPTASASPVAPCPGALVATAVAGTGAGGYTISGVDHGNYDLVVASPSFVTSSEPITLALDTDVTGENVALNQAPSFNALTYTEPAGGGTYAPTAGVCVTLSGGGQTLGPLLTPAVPITGVGGVVTFSDLTANIVYTASYSEYATVPTTPAGCTGPVSGSTTSSFVAQPNNTSVYDAFLAPVLAAPTAHVTFTYQTTGGSEQCTVTTAAADTDAGCPLADGLPTVTVSAIVGYSFSGLDLLLPVESNFAGVCTTDPATGACSGTWTFPGLAGVLEPTVTINVTDPYGEFGSGSATPTLTNGAVNVPINLTPTPVTISGTVVNGNDQVITGTAVHVTATPPNVTVTDAAGTLTWSDSTLGGVTNKAEPGSYSLAATASGYDDSTAAVTVGLCQGGCTTSFTVDMVEQLTYQVTVDAAGLGTQPAGFTPLTADLYDNGALQTSIAVTTNGQVASFADLPPESIGNYSIVVSGQGYQTQTVPALTDCEPATSTCLLTVTATEQGYITGSALALVADASPDNGTTDPDIPSAALSGATVVATLDTADSVIAAGQSGCAATVTTTTDSSGSFALTGAADQLPGGTTPGANGGLCDGAIYQVAFSDAGYDVPAGPFYVDVAAGDNDFGAATPAASEVIGSGTSLNGLQFVAEWVSQTFVVYGPSTATTLTNLPVTVTGSAAGLTFQGNATAVAASGGTTITLAVPPTLDGFSISAPGYVTLTLAASAYQPGSTPSSRNEFLSPDENTVEGNVTTLQGAGAGTSVAVTGLVVDLFPGTGTATVLASATTNGSGAYSFTDVPDGTYYVAPASGSGYALTNATPVTFGTDYPGISGENIAVTPQAVALDVTVTSTLSSADPTGAANSLNGADVTLTPVPGATGPLACAGGGSLAAAGRGSSETAAASLSGTVNFTDLVPDEYDLSVSGGSAPTQGNQVLVVCPNGSATPQAASFAVSEGELAGTATFSVAPTGGATLAVQQGGATVASPTCNVSGTTCTFDSIVGLANGYTVTATATGFNPGTSTSVNLTTASPEVSGVAVPVSAIDRTVTVTVTNSAGTDVVGASVTLSPAEGGTATTNGSGVATFSADVPPGSYTPSASLGGGTSVNGGTIVVPLSPGTVPAGAVQLTDGTLSGTVGPAAAATAGATVTFYSDAARTHQVGIAAVASPTTGAYAEGLPAGTYYLMAAATGYTAEDEGPVTVPDGGTGTQAFTLTP